MARTETLNNHDFHKIDKRHARSLNKARSEGLVPSGGKCCSVARRVRVYWQFLSFVTLLLACPRALCMSVPLVHLFDSIKLYIGVMHI